MEDLLVEVVEAMVDRQEEDHLTKVEGVRKAEVELTEEDLHLQEMKDQEQIQEVQPPKEREVSEAEDKPNH